MKKTILTLALTGIITLSYCGVANALDFSVSKPTVTVNTNKEESALSKKMKEIEQAKADAKAKQAAKQKENEAKKAELQKKVEKAKSDVKAQSDANKKALEQAKSDAKAKQEANKKAAEQKQQERKNAINSLKNSFKY